MARLLTYNDDGDTAPTLNGTVVVDAAEKFDGADSLRFDTNLAYAQWTVLTTIGRAYYVRWYVRIGSLPSANQALLVVLNTGGSICFRVYVTTTGTVRLVNSAGSFVGNPSSAITQDAWHLIEAKVVQQAAGDGTLALRVDDVQVVPDTSASVTNVAINRWRFGRPTTTATLDSMHADAVALNDDQGASDNTYPGSLAPPAPTELRPSGAERRLVVPCGTDNVNNVNEKHGDDRFGKRFVLNEARAIYRMLIGVRLGGVTLDGSGNPAPAEITGSGYGGGNGGTVRFELYAVDAATGLPTGTAIATEQVNAVDRYVQTKNALGLTLQHMWLYAHFATATLAAGEYVVVIRNVAADPLTNFFSVNCPTTSEAAGGPHAANTRSKFAAGAIMGLDPRECCMWSIDAGAVWYWGRPVGGDTVADGIAAPGRSHISGYFVGSGDDAVRLPWYGFLDEDGNKEGLQPYYGSNAPVTNGVLRCKNAGRAVTVTQAGGFAPSGSSPGTITVTNDDTLVSGSVALPGTGHQQGSLNNPVPIAAGEDYSIAFTGTVMKAAADSFQVQTFALGSGDFPFTTDGQGSARAEVYALPWPYFAAPTAGLTDPAPADALGITDGLIPVLARSAVVGDTLAATDASTFGRGVGRAESLALTDVSASAMGRGVPVGDLLGVTDAALAVRLLPLSLGDTLGATDDVAFGRVLALADLLGATDATTRVAETRRVVGDLLDATDAAAFGFGPALVDALGVSDGLARSHGFTMADALGVSDEAVPARAAFFSLADVLGVTDGLGAAIILLKGLGDSLEVADARALAAAYVRSIADAAGIRDETATSTTGAHSRSLADLLSVTDSVQRELSYARAVADALGLTDARGLAVQLAIADAVELADQPAAIQVVIRALDDALTVGDAVSTLLATEGTLAVADLLTLNDAITVVLFLPWTGQAGLGDRGVLVGTGDRGTIGLADAGSTRKH